MIWFLTHPSWQKALIYFGSVGAAAFFRKIWKGCKEDEDMERIEKFGVKALLPRELYEDDIAFKFFIKHTWLQEVEKAGGRPIQDPDIKVVNTVKVKGGQEILPFGDDTDWEDIKVYITGKAYRK